eukprot:g24050.t1
MATGYSQNLVQLVTPPIGQPGMTSQDEGTGWLLQLLKEVQLEQFYLRIRDDLNVTRLSHFDFVKTMDLERIGMGRPGRERFRFNPGGAQPVVSRTLPGRLKSELPLSQQTCSHGRITNAISPPYSARCTGTVAHSSIVPLTPSSGITC